MRKGQFKEAAERVKLVAGSFSNSSAEAKLEALVKGESTVSKPVKTVNTKSPGKSKIQLAPSTDPFAFENLYGESVRSKSFGLKKGNGVVKDLTA